MSIQENRFTRPIVCTHCGNKAPMRMVAEYSQVREYSDGNFDWEDGPAWILLLCPACDNVLLQKTFWHSHREDLPDPEIVFPTSAKHIEGLPDNIESAYRAAIKVKAIDSNAFAVLLGRVIDQVCIDKGAEGESLHDRLKDLATKTVIPLQLAEMAHAIRHLRNIGAHADLGELTPKEVPILDDLCKAILEYVYAAPAMMMHVQKKIDLLKTKNLKKVSTKMPAKRASTKPRGK